MTRYPIKTSRHSSHSQIARIVGQGNGRWLLDVGCADGTLSERFVASGWRVVGIEPFASDAAIARARGIEVMEMTLEDAVNRLDQEFDAVVLADVLEHCADPWSLLREIVSHCKPGAVIVITVPNVAHLATRIQLFFGQFKYVDRGILDRTHLRFFTQSTAMELVEHAGLHLAQITVTPTPVELVFPSIMKSMAGNALLSFLANFTKVFPRVFGYQFVMICKIADSAESP